MYKVKDFDYHLPAELIAQQPQKPRDYSRLLLLNKKTGAMEHKCFHDLVDYLKPGDLLVLNNSKVFPARLIGHKAETGGLIEVFLHKKLPSRQAIDSATSDQAPFGNLWECLLGGRIKEGLNIDFSCGLRAEVIKNNNDGTWRVGFNFRDKKFWTTVNKIGLVPLPPYIKRGQKNAHDKNNYQTVYADDAKVGSVAAPTAGLHFTKSLLKKIKARGVKIAYVTLHVGLGTFAPVKTEKIKEHKMHGERAEISASTIRDILAAKKAGGRVIAVGTTSCRTLEALNFRELKIDGRQKSAVKKQAFWTDIFIYPGHKFQAVDALITNFHLPKSTLLMLVSALAGKKAVDKAYREAVRRQYRFFSYGDAMFIY
jgi:S-adenosylmethionine:tRNA ribosyltransferase-isomerase